MVFSVSCLFSLFFLMVRYGLEYPNFYKKLYVLLVPLIFMVITALIHNLLRRHSSINYLVHWEDGNETGKDDSQAQKEIVDAANDSGAGTNKSVTKLGIYYFNHEESNPVKSNAEKSSLREIDPLRHHYCPPVYRFVLSLENDLTVERKSLKSMSENFVQVHMQQYSEKRFGDG